jgi:phage major head subunit gpT-like protein
MSSGISAAIIAATTTFIALFKSSLRGAPATPADDLCAKRGSKGDKNTYRYLPLGVPFEELKGSIDFREDAYYSYSLSNKVLAAGFQVGIDEFEDAQHNGLEEYEDRSRELGLAPNAHKRRLIAEVLNNGFTATGPDGVTFFNVAHPISPKAPSGAVRQNRLTSNPVLSAANFETAHDLLLKMPAYNGDVLHVTGRGELVLTVPTALRGTAEEILMQERLSSGESNPNYKRAKLRVMPELDTHSATAWYLSVEGEGAPKPLIMQTRKDPQMTSQTNPESDAVFKDRKVRYKVEARYNAGYHHCEMIVASDGTAS